MIEHQSIASYASPDEHDLPDGVPDVLVVEDDPEINELIGAYVELSGFSCRRVTRGDEALREVHRHRPALIVLDVMLPDLDGFEICRRIRSDPHTAAIPIIMLTALDQEEMRCRAVQCGASDYLTKPFDPDRLMAAIRQRADTGRQVAVHSVDQA
jgi:DNA-binding response OmpR family regulator